VISGRRVCGQETSKDVLSPTAQRHHGFTVNSLPDRSSGDGLILDEALHDNTQTPVDEQVCFRLDFPAWLLTRSDRDCRMVLDLMRGERTLDVSRKYGTTPARISQLRRDFRLLPVGEAKSRRRERCGRARLRQSLLRRKSTTFFLFFLLTLAYPVYTIGRKVSLPRVALKRPGSSAGCSLCYRQKRRSRTPRPWKRRSLGPT
jgi:hypothetical protein